MHLTRFEIHRGRRGAQKLLGSPQAMHAAVCLAFPTPDPAGNDDPLDLIAPSNGSPDVGQRVLWRVDDDGRRAVLYLVSPQPPDLTHLVEQAGWPSRPDSWTTRSYDTFLQRLTPGQQWAFRLTANPTHAVRLPGQKRSQRLGHVTADQQTRWLLDRAQAHGFRVLTTGAGDGATSNDEVSDDRTRSEPALIVHHRQMRGFRRRDPHSKGNSQVTLATAMYDGLLQVQDAALLRHALTNGIGPAKAYGCGLLTLARST